MSRHETRTKIENKHAHMQTPAVNLCVWPKKRSGR